jgi:hypothetical protein
MFLRNVRIYAPNYTVSFPIPPSKYSFPEELQILYELKNTVLWVIMPCSSEKARRFGGTYSLHLQGRRVSQARRQLKQAVSRDPHVESQASSRPSKPERPDREPMGGQEDSERAQPFQLKLVFTKCCQTSLSSGHVSPNEDQIKLHGFSKKKNESS